MDQQQQLLMLQQLQAAAMSRFQNPNPNSTPNSGGGVGGSSGLNQTALQHQKAGGGGDGCGGQVIRKAAPVNQSELVMAYHDAWRVCHPDWRHPIASLEDACERLLPYHVVADYEAEEDDRILDSDTTGMMSSRCQQWDHNITAKVAEFTGTFEKQALAFNLITQKRALGDFRSEERLMIEQALLQEEKRLLLGLKTEMNATEKAGREAQLRMAAMVQAKQVRAESMTRGNAIGLQGNNMAVQ